MKKIKLMIDDKVIEASISDEDAKKLVKRKTGLEKPEHGEDYRCIDSDGKIYSLTYEDECDESIFESDNGFTDEQLAKDTARARIIKRTLLEYIAEHNAKPLDWTDEAQDKFFIYYDYDTGELAVDFNLSCKDLNQLYFETEESARNAIEKFKDDLIWHITEFQPYIGAYKKEI